MRSAIRDAPAQLAFAIGSPVPGYVEIMVEQVPRDWGWVQRDGSDTAKRFFGRIRVPEATLVW